jgi:hypothetical protein
MKAIVIRQPWASLIAQGNKTVEIRSRRTSHRGDLLVVAAKQPVWFSCPTGIALAVVSIVDCRPMIPSDAEEACIDYRPGYWAWKLSNVRPVPPVPVRGMPGIFDFSPPSKNL